MNVFENPVQLGTLWSGGYPVYAVPPTRSAKISLGVCHPARISTEFRIEFDNWLRETFGMESVELIQDYCAVYVKDKNAFLVNKFTYEHIKKFGNRIDLQIMNRSAMN